MSHDQLFKTLLEVFLADFLHLAVPDLARRLDLDRYRILPTEHFTDLPQGEERRLDLVVEIPVLDGDAAEDAEDAEDLETGFVHVEIEREARSGMAARMWDYGRVLALRGRRPALPIVLYLRGGPAGVLEIVAENRFLHQILGTFHFYSFALSGCRAVHYLRSDRPLAWALAALMRPPLAWSRAEHRTRCLRPIVRAERIEQINAAEARLLINCVETYLELDEDDLKEQDMVMSESEQERISRLVMAPREALFNSGRVAGLREFLLGVIEQRLGTIPDNARTRIEEIEEETELQSLGERLFMGDDLEALGLA